MRVPSNGGGLFPEVQREDRESARGVVAVKLLEDRQLGTALETSGRPDIEKDHAALQILQGQGVPVVEATPPSGGTT